ncbi:MAG TPA: DUF4412 domain-containing protein [Chthoniobacteraceae bacterium]|jgi:hypothetical protein|nr:DUF4412 domain-containing protein [Chthoniobacteraceae bacterium]
MKLSLSLLALLLTVCWVRADLVIVENVDSGTRTGQMTVKVGTDKVRADMPSQVSTITDTATGEITTLMHAQRVYMVITAAAGKAMMAQFTKMMQANGGIASSSPPPLEATGKTDKINGYDAKEYVFNNGTLKASYWMSTDFPNGQKVAEALAKVRKGSLADLTKAFAPDLTTLPGVPVKTEIEINGQKTTTELVSATEQPVDPSEYQIPASYTQMQVPMMPQPH